MPLRLLTWWNVLLLGVLLGGSLFIAATRVPATTGNGAAPPRQPTPASESSAPQAPAFALPTVDGTMVALWDVKGQVVLINVWTTWCPPCQAEMPAIEATYKRSTTYQPWT